MIQIDVILLVGAVVLIAAIIAARIGARIGLPSLLLFLGLGMVMGESGIGISFDDANLAQALGFAALVVILAEGGLTTKWSDIRSSTILAALLATFGVGISVGLMTLFGHYVLGRRSGLRCCWARLRPRPMLRRSFRCSATFPFRTRCEERWRPSPASTMRPLCCSSWWQARWQSAIQ